MLKWKRRRSEALPECSSRNLKASMRVLPTSSQEKAADSTPFRFPSARMVCSGCAIDPHRRSLLVLFELQAPRDSFRDRHDCSCRHHKRDKRFGVRRRPEPSLALWTGPDTLPGHSGDDKVTRVAGSTQLAAHHNNARCRPPSLAFAPTAGSSSLNRSVMPAMATVLKCGRSIAGQEQSWRTPITESGRG